MATSNNLVQSEVLFFILGSIDAHPASMIKKSVMEFYREDEISSCTSGCTDEGDSSSEVR